MTTAAPKKRPFRPVEPDRGDRVLLTRRPERVDAVRDDEVLRDERGRE